MLHHFLLVQQPEWHMEFCSSQSNPILHLFRLGDSLVGMGASLAGVCQISKLSMIPVVCVMEWILNGKHFSREVKIAVAVVVVGVGACTVTDVKFNAKGFLCACVAILCTLLQQISIGSLQKKYSIGPFELLSKTAPIQALSLLVLGPFVEYFRTGKLLTDYKLSTGVFFFILLSCSLAVFCNISQYLCIGRFSAVSFQVLGHMKTVHMAKYTKRGNLEHFGAILDQEWIAYEWSKLDGRIWSKKRLGMC